MFHQEENRTCHNHTDCKHLLVDETPMTHHAAFEAVNRTLRYIREGDRPTGGIPTLLCGDFRQILPVVRHRTRANIVGACIKSSYLWDSVTVRHLETNMRVYILGDSAAAEFVTVLLSTGTGEYPKEEPPDVIQLSSALGTVMSTSE